MAKTQKLTHFMAHAIKLANKRSKEEQHIKKIQRQAKIEKRNYGCGGHLPTDTDWDAVVAERNSNRFYADKLVKGQNVNIQAMMINL